MVDWLREADIYIFKLINVKLHFNPLDRTFIFITGLDYTYIAVLLALFLLVLRKKHHLINAVLILASAQLNWFSSSLLKRLFNRPRPPQIGLSGINLLIDCGKGLSFPSAHTVIAFSIATVVAIRYPRLKYFAFFFALLVGYSRIYAGVHFPSDVLAGAILGMLITYALLKLTSEKLWQKI